jgi:predicted amidohydrolase YtcJ
MIEAKFERLLDMFEDINRTTDITGLRWSFHHGYAMTDQQMVRAKALGMVLGLHTTSTLLGTRWLQATGGSVLEMPPFRSAQESGIPWGLGTDAGIVSPYQAFFTLYFAVTGKDPAGRTILKDQTVTREEALIAHTRSNAYHLFQEDNLGTLEVGKYADLVVLDRDYLTIPDEEIKDIQSVLTIVGGRVGFEAPK